MSVRDYATEEIMKDLAKEGKSFMAFREDLDPVMDTLVQQYEEEQIELKKQRYEKANR